jgi:hypothetical protein
MKDIHNKKKKERSGDSMFVIQRKMEGSNGIITIDADRVDLNFEAGWVKFTDKQGIIVAGFKLSEIVGFWYDGRWGIG